MQYLKSWLIKQLNGVLCTYIDNLDPTQFNLGITSGELVLKNLVIKKSVLNEFLPSVQAVYGHIARLKIGLPSSMNLSSVVFEVAIDGLYILLEPKSQDEYNEEKENAKIQAEKQNQLANIELTRKQKREAAKKEEGYFSRLREKYLMMAVRNIEVRLTKVHIRYEDRTINPEFPIAMGVTLSRILVETTDKKFLSHEATADPFEDMLRAFKVRFLILTLERTNVTWTLYITQ
nr:vacuolar protein sorting-associated protein 13A-like [Onthophagus taurus]